MKTPYLICEVGLNHEGDYPRAVQMIEAAAAAGANAVKFQYVKADRLVSKRAPTYFEQRGPTAPSQHGFFARSDQLDRADYELLAKACRIFEVDFLCTVFDMESVHWIAPLVPAFKVASADITNIPLLEAIASYRKPVYMSMGAATRTEVTFAWDTLRSALRPDQITPLHCVLSYPTPPDQANLGVIRFVRDRDWQCGYSDHTLFNLDVLTTAWLLGATVIEKHFTLDKTLPGNDHYHSMDPADLRALVAKFKELQAMIGDGEKRVLPIEEAARLNARQSWHATKDLRVGEVLRSVDVVLKRPGSGAPASFDPIGWTLLVDVKADEPIPDPVTLGIAKIPKFTVTVEQ